MRNQTALNLIMRFEGFRARPYLCSAGVPTIGYGSTRYADGSVVTMKDPPISEGVAKALLDITTERCQSEMAKLCTPMLTEEEAKRAAVLSFLYNLGASRFRSSTYRKRLLIGNWESAAGECRKWVFSGGKKTPGLIIRREVEARLLLGLK